MRDTGGLTTLPVQDFKYSRILVSLSEQGVIRKHADNFKGAEAGAGSQMSMGMGAMAAMSAMSMMPPGMMPMPGYGAGMKRGRESEGPYIANKMQHRPRSMGGAATGDAMEVGTFFFFSYSRRRVPHPVSIL